MRGIGRIQFTVRTEQLRSLGNAAPNRPVIQPCPGSVHWIEFLRVDQDGAPVPDQPYEIRLPDHECGKLRWCEPGSGNTVLSSAPAASCPYLGLPGRRERIVVEHDESWSDGLP
jgi:hypothetical protein